MEWNWLLGGLEWSGCSCCCRGLGSVDPLLKPWSMIMSTLSEYSLICSENAHKNKFLRWRGGGLTSSSPPPMPYHTCLQMDKVADANSITQLMLKFTLPSPTPNPPKHNPALLFSYMEGASFSPLIILIAWSVPFPALWKDGPCRTIYTMLQMKFKHQFTSRQPRNYYLS